MNNMKTLAIFLLLTTSAFAHKTAQQAAEASAAGGLRHRGGNPSYEGLGCSSTPESAFRSCCYANSSNLVTYDVGIAQGRNGLWVCCRRYVSKGAIHRIGDYLARAGLKRQRTCVADCFCTLDESEEKDGE